MASINNGAAGYEYTPGDGSAAEKRDKARQAAAANGGTAPVGTSGGNGKVSWSVTGTADKAAANTGIPKQSAKGASSSGGNGGSSGTSNANPGSMGYRASAAAASGGGSANSGAGLTGFTLGSGGFFTDDNGKQYNVQQYTRQPDGTIRNDTTGEIINKQGQVTGRTASGYDYSGKDYAGRAYGQDGAMRTLTQAEKDAIAKASPGSSFNLGGVRYDVNADGGVTITTEDGHVLHTLLDNGEFSGTNMHTGGDGRTAGDYAAVGEVMRGGSDVSSLTPGQKEIYDQWQHSLTAADPMAAAKQSAGMPQGWTEYAYDSEGKPFAMSTQGAWDFLYNSTAKTMTGANGIKFTRNDDGTVTITESSGRTSVWRPGSMYSTYNPSFQTEAQRQGTLQLSSYDAAYLSPEDQQAVAALKKAYAEAKARGDEAAMEASNQQANAIRTKYGYTGGGDGASFRLLGQEQKSLDSIDLGSYESALQGMNYTPMVQGGNWANALMPSSSMENLTRYNSLANTLRPEQLGGYDLGNFESALGGVSRAPAALQAGDEALADFSSALAGVQYSGPSRAAEQALGGIDLGSYQSALAGMQYAPQGYTQEEALARTVLPQYQAAYSGLTGKELANRDYSQMENAALQGYEAQTGAVNQVYDAQNAAQLAALRQAYENSRAEAERGMSKIASAYQQQKNTTAAESEVARRNYQEQAAASGLNAGNRGQAALAFSNQLQSNLGQLSTAEANAMSDAQFELNRLYSDYQNQISQAIAQNNYERAAALLQEYQTAQKSKVETALNQANLNLQTADFNRQVRNDQTNAMQQDFQNRLSLAQGRQSDQQAAADLAYRQAGLDLQTAQYNREGRQLQREAAQQDWQNRLTLAQMQDAAAQDAWNRAYQQAGLNLDIAQYNREGRNLDWQAAQQEYANYLNFLQAQEAARQSAFDRSLQTAAFNREGRQMEYDTAMRSYEAELARAQAQDAAQQAAWDRAYQQAGLDLNVRQFNQDAMKDYYQAQQQDFTNRMAVNQEARDAQAQAYDQAYRKVQMDMDSWSLNQDVQQRNFQNRLALAQAQDAAYQAQADRAYQQANLDLSVWDRNRQAEQDRLARQQQLFDNQRTLSGEQYQRDVFDWQRQQDEMDRKERAAQTEWDQAQQKWENGMALTELGAQYGDMNRLSYYGYTPAQMQQMYRFAQMDRLGKILW